MSEYQLNQTVLTNDKSSWIGEISAKFYADRRLSILVVLLITASGLSSMLVLPRMEDPQLAQRAAMVTTVLPGADAERVEALVTEKIEEKLLDIAEIKKLRSQSRAGSSVISIELRDDIYETDPVWSRVRGKLEDSIADLPSGASRPEFDETEVAAFAWIGAIVWTSEAPESIGILRRLARELEDYIRAIPGTKEVSLFGDPGEEIAVEINPRLATSLGMSAAEIAAQLVGGDARTAAGMIRGSQSEYVVEVANQFKNLEDIRITPIRGRNPGQTVVLSDVASVRRTTPEPMSTKAIVDGKPAVVVGVLLQSNFRIDQWNAKAQKVLADFESRLPSGVKLDLILNQNRYVNDRINTLAWNLFLGAAAVSVVTLLLMGWRSAVLVTATLPLASLMVLFGMRTLGIPIHQMSITGLIIALGLLIDNAIIAVDEVAHSLKNGYSGGRAVANTVSRLAGPLFASTVTTALAFAPLALMEGPAGEFVGSIGITVMLAIFSSLLLALTAVPAVAAGLLRIGGNTGVQQNHEKGTQGPTMLGIWKRGLSVPTIARWYNNWLYYILRRPVVGIASGMILPIAGFVAATQLSEQFFPPADRDQFHIEVDLDPQASMAKTEELVKRIDQELAQIPEIRRTDWFIGESAPPFYYNIIPKRKNSPNYAQAIISIDSNEGSADLIRKLQLKLDKEFAESLILVKQLEQGPPFTAPIEVRLFGPDLDELQNLGEVVQQSISQIADVIHVRSELSQSRPVASVQVDQTQARMAGLSEQQIASQLYARLEGLTAGSIIEGVEEIPVRVRIDDSERNDFERLGDGQLVPTLLTSTLSPATAHTKLPEVLPVSAVAEVTLESQRAAIIRYNGRRMNEIQGYLTAGVLPSKVLTKFQEKIDQGVLTLPAGYWLEFGGEASERDSAVSRLMANVSILAVGMVAALVLALGSFRLTALIGAVAVLSIGLGLGSLWLFGYSFGFMAIIGTMGLIGVAINDSIVVVTALRDNPQAKAGDHDAITSTIMSSTRHVLATTFTTMVGFLPLLLGGGGFWPPLAVAIGSGVIGATLIALTFIPSVFYLMHRPNRQSSPALA